MYTHHNIIYCSCYLVLGLIFFSEVDYTYYIMTVLSKLRINLYLIVYVNLRLRLLVYVIQKNK